VIKIPRAYPAERFEQLKEYLRFYPNLQLDEEDDEQTSLASRDVRRGQNKVSSLAAMP